MKKYFIDCEEVNEKDFYRCFKMYIQWETEKDFNKYLNEKYGRFQVGAYCFSASSVLKELNEEEYDELFEDYCINKMEEYKNELEIKKYIIVYGYELEIYEGEQD